MAAAHSLTAARLRELLHYDPSTGVFTWLVQTCNSVHVGDVAGGVSGDYWRLCIEGRHYWAHRVALLYMTGEWPANDIDHIDGIGTNNIFENLRDVTTAINVQNVKRGSRNSLSGLLGVETTRYGTFKAAIMAFGKKHHLGTFTTPEAAHAAYLEAKRRLHPGCTI